MSCFSNSPNHHSGEDGVQTSRANTSSITTPPPPSGESSSTIHPPAPPLPSPLKESSPSTTPFEAGSLSSTLPFPAEQQYEVFLSFRGETRRGFTDHLYKGLINAKVSVFRDKEGLPVGERNWPKIVKAIETSKISILIISPNYASSEWCLNELIQILKCKETFGQFVIPIFYHVTPSDLRKKADVLEEESRPCKKRRLDSDVTHVQIWKDAMIEISYMTGLESEEIADGYEGELVDIVVTKVLEALKALRKPTLYVSDDLVGVDYHVEKIMKMVNVEGSNDVHAILIHGMGGIGKTTLAKVIYNRLTHFFYCYSFLANVRETWWSQHKGEVELQEQLILDIFGEKESISSVDKGVEIIRDKFKNKKVLILLDDVDHRDQLNALAGKRDWFGRGSMLIVTSRVNNVPWEGAFSYELDGLNYDESFLLFCKHAFKKSHPTQREFHTIAKEIVSITGGLPSAIEVIGSLLYGKNQRIWEEKLKKLKNIPDGEVQNKLKISFDALEHEEQQIFLDIACLPIHKEREREFALHMWESCDFYPVLGIEKLISMSMIKIGERKELVIHDLLRDLGREIVRKKSISNLGERSRLWKSEEAWEVLEMKKGTEKVETLCLVNYKGRKRSHYTREQFEGMTELRYLHMHRVNLIRGDFKNLFQNLRWLRWTNGELDFMETNFIPKKLVVLQLQLVNITKEWMGWNQMKGLKVLNLSRCDSLTAVPDLSALEELEVLFLGWCFKLIEIHPSIGKLRKLKVLAICYCKKLKLPIQVGKMEGLRELSLNLQYMPLIREIPIVEGCMTKLETLSVTYSQKVKSIPDSVGSLVKLQRLVLRGCELLTEIPKSIGNLKLLIEIDLRWTGVTQLPDSIGDLCNLESLLLVGTPMICLPTSIQALSKLQVLDLWGCDELESLPSLPRSLTSLEFYGNLMETLPDFPNLTNLELLRFKDDFKRWNRALDFRNLNRMRTLQFKDSIVEFGFSDSTINCRRKIHRHQFKGFEILGSESKLSNINLLLVLPSNLVEIELVGCYTLRTLPNFSNLKGLSLLHISSCPELMKINGLNGAEKLKDLTISDCRNLVEINGLDKADSIREVSISRCPSLERIGDLSHLKMLTTLELRDCPKLSETQGRENLTSLRF